MNIDKDIKVGELLKAYPFLKDELKKNYPQLNTIDKFPLNMLVNNYTIEQVSNKVNISVEDIIKIVTDIIKKHN